ncbi:MAG: hypothetical protein SNJ59_16650 [Aggregatilineales bacterium]
MVEKTALPASLQDNCIVNDLALLSNALKRCERWEGALSRLDDLPDMPE